jgi:hypothetical protein
VPAPPDVHFSQEANPVARLKTVALDQHEWRPVLLVGDRQIAQLSFTDSGVLNRTGVGRLGAATGRGLSGALGAFGQATEAVAPGVLTGEWIQYEIRSPGRPARKIRRQLFDLIGPAARASGTTSRPNVTDAVRRAMALAFLGRTDVLLVNCQYSHDFVAHLVAVALEANRRPLEHLVQAPNPGAFEDAAGEIARLPTPLYGIALARSDWNRNGKQTYLDRPDILTEHELIREDPTGSLLHAYGFDIVANDVAVVPGPNVDSTRVRLEQGVIDTNVEAALAAQSANESGLTAPRHAANISEIYAAPADNGVDWLTIRSQDDPAWARVGLSNDVRARISEDLAAGYVIVAPSRPLGAAGEALVGWWQIDPETGQLLGRGDQGWGQALPEYAMVLELTAKSIIIGMHTAFCLHAVGHHTAPGVTQTVGVGLCLMSGFVAQGWFGGGEAALLAGELVQALTELGALNLNHGPESGHTPE